ncbi:MAG: hypothetical protein E7H07_11585 [Staphylococcus epidermidis]|nr:hypothetical protein [Staphylococcus epidermidis]
MVVRKIYDHWGIEISTWNKSNIVTFIDCDCGQLAKRELGVPSAYEEFVSIRNRFKNFAVILYI